MAANLLTGNKGILAQHICAFRSPFEATNQHILSWKRIFPKTMAILTGELGIDDLIENGHNVFGSRIEIVYILFLIFLVFVCNIVLMNVFTGLAVGDVANVMNKAEVGFELQAIVFSWKFKCSHRISYTVDR